MSKDMRDPMWANLRVAAYMFNTNPIIEILVIDISVYIGIEDMCVVLRHSEDIQYQTYASYIHLYTNTSI